VRTVTEAAYLLAVPRDYGQRPWLTGADCDAGRPMARDASRKPNGRQEVGMECAERLKGGLDWRG